MKLNFILLTICALFFNFANGYFISNTMSNQIKEKLVSVFGTKPNRISGIISAPEFGISHEPTEIVDDDNKVDDQTVSSNQQTYPIFFKPRPINQRPVNQRPVNQGLMFRPLKQMEPLKQISIEDGKIEQEDEIFGVVGGIGLDEPVISGGSIEHFPRPNLRPRFGNLRGKQQRLGERSLHISNYIEDEDIIEYNELDFFGPESNPDIYPSNLNSFSIFDTTLDTNIQSECATANYLRKAGFPESSIGTMVCIAKYESGFNCDATNKNTDGSTDYGEFQINSYWWCSGDAKSKYNGCGTSCSSLFNCQSNANCAYTVWKQQGYNAWYGYQNHKSTCDTYPKPC